MEKIENIIKDAKKELTEERYIHSIGVMERCEELAKIYNQDIEKAKLIGIAHDIAKQLGEEKSYKYIKENKIEIDEIEKKVPSLLHGKIGAHIAKTKYGFDKQMCLAIEYHTTGNRNMDMLAKILYAADKTEKNRKFEEYDIEYERKLANENINVALIYMIEEAIKININRKKLIHPESICTRNKLLDSI